MVSMTTFGRIGPRQGTGDKAKHQEGRHIPLSRAVGRAGVRHMQREFTKQEIETANRSGEDGSALITEEMRAVTWEHSLPPIRAAGALRVTVPCSAS